MDDKEIIRLLFVRAEDALDALALKFGSGVRRLARNILSSPQDAEEAVNDTWIALWTAIPPASPDPLAPYVYRVCRNTALNRLRHESAKKRSAFEISLDEFSDTLSGPGLDETLEARVLGQAIDRWLDTQNRDNRVIFLRRYWFGDSVRDIAAVMGLRENAVTVRLNRLRKKLRDYLMKEGLYE